MRFHLNVLLGLHFKDGAGEERVKRFELSTPTLARLCSTPELHPHHGYSYIAD